MKRARIEYEIEGDTRVATFEADGVVAADFPPVAVLLVQVRDAEDSDALVALIEKHDKANVAPPKKRKPRTATKQAAAATSNPVNESKEPDDPRCVAHADGRHVRTGGAPCLCEPANPDTVTPGPAGAKNAKKILEDLARKPDLAAPAPLPHGAAHG